MFIDRNLGEITSRTQPGSAFLTSEHQQRTSGRVSALVHGLPGHPLHPPLTDATIGMFVLAAGLAVIGYAGGIEDKAGPAAWLALIGGLGRAAPPPLSRPPRPLSPSRGSG